MSNESSKTGSTLDVVGATASMLCAIHCLAMPLLLATLPALGLGWLLSQNLERGFVISAVALAIANTCWGFRIHRKTRVLWFSVLGGIFLLIATFGHSHELPHEHSHMDHETAIHSEDRPQSTWAGLGLLIGGALFISTAHYLNRRFCRSCHHCHHDEVKA